MKTTLLLMITLIALAVVIFWSSQQSSEPRAATIPEQIGSGTKPNSKGTAEAPTIQTPLAPAPETETPAANIENDRKEAAWEKVDFDAKYKGWSLERLVGSQAVLNMEVQRVVNEVFDERMKQGLFEELVLKEGESTPAFSEPTQVHGENAGKGLVRYKIVRNPVAEYPRVKALKDEQGWLGGKIYRLSNPAKQ